MAGTSGDGIDAAAISVRGRGESMKARLLLHLHRSFPPGLRKRLLRVMAPAATTTQEIARLHADLGEAFGTAAAEAVQRLGSAHRPLAIGLAGQTVCHLPGDRAGRTVGLQLGDAARVAARAGLPVVSDFRQSDIALGGQGAPLVPWTDWVLFHHPRQHRIVQNIGGIANLTWIPAHGTPAEVIAFDSGPGNMVIDALAAEASKGRASMDRDGRLAARGRVLEDVLARWLDHPFFKRRPPRSTGRETFGRPFIEAELPRLRAVSPRPEDWIATATAFTAQTIVAAYRRWLPGFSDGVDGGPETKPRTRRSPKKDGKTVNSEHICSGDISVVICGGGSRNPVLMAMLKHQWAGASIVPIDSFGIPTQSKEALSFALLAAAFLDGVPANLPRVTGARCPGLLGRINFS